MTIGKTKALNIQTFFDKVVNILIRCLGFHNFSSMEQVSFNFVTALTIHSDFGAQENKIYHCFQFFPIYLQ